MDGEEQLIFGHSRSQCDRSANGNDRQRSLESPSTRRQRAPSYEHELMTVMEKVNRAVPANKPAAMRGRRINKAKNMQQTSTNQAITLLNSRLDTISEALGSVIIQLGVSPVSVAVGGEVPAKVVMNHCQPWQVSLSFVFTVFRHIDTMSRLILF